MERLQQDDPAPVVEKSECYADPCPDVIEQSPGVNDAYGMTSALATENLLRLAQTIESEIIPRLMLAHGQNLPAEGLQPSTKLGPESNAVADFVKIVLGDDYSAARDYVEAARSRDVSLEVLCADLLTPAARTLGQMWDEDICDFVQVTLALWRLHNIIRDLGPEFSSNIRQAERALSILLVPSPGEEHTLGLLIVGEFFRRGGWRVWGDPPASIAELREIVRGDWFDVVGLSISCESRMPMLAESIRAVRQASLNPSVGVMVGGPIFDRHPEFVATVGADSTSVDGRHAPHQAEKLVALLTRPKAR